MESVNYDNPSEKWVALNVTWQCSNAVQVTQKYLTGFIHCKFLCESDIERIMKIGLYFAGVLFFTNINCKMATVHCGWHLR